MSAPFTLGHPEHPPLVFLHGFLGRGQSWLGVARPLSTRFHCILPDLPGHGHNTSGDPAAPLTFDTLASWLNRLLDDLNLQRVHLVGYSLGGRTALHFACHYPSRLHSLTLESTSPGILDETERARRRAEDDTRAADILQHGMPAFVEKWYTMPLFASLHQHPHTLSDIKTTASQNDPRWMARIVSDLSPGRQTPLWDCLPHLPMPVLLLSGTLDSRYAHISQKMAALIPNARTLSLPAAGHNVHAEQPQAVQAALQQFYDRTVQ